MYCIYLTVYKGNKFPKRYIGSTKVDRILKQNYHGSVLSKKYKLLWKEELKNNPHLFKTRILKTFSTHEEALEAELNLQLKYNVVKSDSYINMSLAQPNGFFGMPSKGRKRSRESIEKGTEKLRGRKRPDHSAKLKGRKKPEHSIAMSGKGNPMYGKVHPNKGKKIDLPKCCCLKCGATSTRSLIIRHHTNCNRPFKFPENV